LFLRSPFIYSTKQKGFKRERALPIEDKRRKRPYFGFGSGLDRYGPVRSNLNRYSLFLPLLLYSRLGKTGGILNLETSGALHSLRIDVAYGFTKA
jgi:hypothetical protein